MNYTQNYQLPQWEKTDRIMMDDFNDAMAKLDAGVHACDYVFGTYEGTSPTDKDIQQEITLGFRPRAVLIFPNSQRVDGRPAYALTFDGIPNNNATIIDSGFIARGATNFAPGNNASNISVNPYRYMAFR